MLDIKAYASGSKGNCYTVTDGDTTILIDPGIPIDKVRKSLHFVMPDAVLLTHEHKDHSKAVPDLMNAGIDCYMTQGTAEAMAINGHRLKVCSHGQPFRIGNVICARFNVQHDSKEPVGFLIMDSDDKVLYATDTYYVRYVFNGLTKIMVEVNHSYEIIQEKVRAGILNRFQAQRLMKSHFALENVLKFLEANDLSKVKEIWLLHMSSRNSDPRMFKEAIMRKTGLPVYIAKGERYE